MAVEPRRRHLVIFARRPQYGVGKRRLAREIGDLEALRFARRSLAALRRRLADCRRWTSWIAGSPDRPLDWAGAGRGLPQGGGNLGARMSRVLVRMPPGPVVIIGADTPGVRRADIVAAFRALGSADAVFGPAADGGYWLIGLRRPAAHPDVFRDVRWSSPDALADTLRNLEGRRVAVLAAREDVDDAGALARLQSCDFRPW